jgi:uncharacterized OB-fold protein
LKTVSKAALIIVGVLMAAVIVVFSLDQPGGPIRARSGVIVGAVLNPNDTGPSFVVATVALREGGNVQARVVAPSPVKTGQSVRLNEYRGVVTGHKTYEVVAIEGGT